MPSLRHLNRRLTSERFDARLGQVACWLTAAAIIVLGTLKLTRLGLDETQLFFGVLLVFTLALLAIVTGLLLPMSVALSGRKGPDGT